MLRGLQVLQGCQDRVVGVASALEMLAVEISDSPEFSVRPTYSNRFADIVIEFAEGFRAGCRGAGQKVGLDT